MTSKPPIELIIFDCDGVLVDSEVIFFDILYNDLCKRGLELSADETMQLFVGGSMEAVKVELVSRGLELPDSWIEDLYARVLNKLKQGVDPVDGIHDLLNLLVQNELPFCVASNGPVHKMDVTLGSTGLMPFFENAVFSAYEINSWKPEPELFLAAAKHFNVPAARCMVIEDSHNGTLAAKNAGMPCLGYAPHGPDERLTNNGAVCFTHMSEVAGFLNLRDGAEKRT